MGSAFLECKWWVKIKQMVLLNNRISVIMLWVYNYAPEDKEKQSLPAFWKWDLLPWIASEVWVWFVDQHIVLKQNYRWYTLKNWVWWLQKNGSIDDKDSDVEDEHEDFN